ncbi:MAG: AI-2E family transporter [Spirochaetes bacterium]|nr:AI-2E family transporter [Spirochaetota bacterium]
MMTSEQSRKKIRIIIYLIMAVITALAGFYLLWLLRSLILPFLIGTFTAYICFPLIDFAKRKGVPRGIAIFLLFGIFVLMISVAVNRIGSILPDEKEKLVLKTRLQYKINEKYREIMDLNKPDSQGNFLYGIIGKDLNRTMAKINDIIALSDQEKALFMKYWSGYKGKPPIEDRYFDYFKKNLESSEITIEELESEELAEKTSSKDEPGKESVLSIILDIIELWIVMPFVFLFLLIDDGEIKRYFVSLIPNRYFEVSLTVIDNVNNAIGNYLRGTMIECSLVGISSTVLLALIGFELKWAIIIGVFSGLTNAIPLVGPVFGLLTSVFYALIVEDINSILPFINMDNLMFWVVICLLIIRALDTAVFQPVLVGNAVNLHPLVVILGLIGGSMLFGTAGLILTIPLIVVIRVFFSTLLKELKDYRMI